MIAAQARFWLLALVAASGFLLGCGSVVPLQPSERAVVGWGLGLNYCLEPSGVERAAGALVLASTYGVNQAGVVASAQEPSPPSVTPGSSPTLADVQLAQAQAAKAQAHAHAIAEISLFARESLYRICEARRNGDMCPKDALIERQNVTALVADLVKAQVLEK